MRWLWIFFILSGLCYAQSNPEQNKEKIAKKQKIEQITANLKQKITIKLTQNPKGKPLTMGYALHKILKKSKIKYLSKKTKRSLPEINKMKINRVIANKMEVARLLKIIAGSRGIYHHIIAKGIYFDRNKPKIPTPKQNSQTQDSKKETKKTTKKVSTKPNKRNKSIEYTQLQQAKTYKIKTGNVTIVDQMAISAPHLPRKDMILRAGERFIVKDIVDIGGGKYYLFQVVGRGRSGYAKSIDLESVTFLRVK